MLEARPRQKFMFAPLASHGRGRKYICVSRFLTISAICAAALFALAQPAMAQVEPPEAPRQDIPAPEPLPIPIPDGLDVEPDAREPETDSGIITEELVTPPDYSKLSPEAEREAKLDDMFARLKLAPNAEDANLVAEEIWAIWLESGSASVNLVLRRGSDAQKKGKSDLARRMFNHVITLQPDYAEGWARSSRLALEEKDYSRSLVEASQALVLEPRHFYALWTMGNVFEQLGRQDDALEAYREAHKLYPELKAVKDRLEALEGELEGAVL